MNKIAVIGCGHWGKNLVRNFAELAALGAIVDPDPERAAALGKAHDAPGRTFPEVLADTTISGVAIAAPAELHAKLALEAIAAGKDVFVEKPLALTIVDAEAVIAAAETAGRVLMVGHLLHYHSGYRGLVEAVRGGRLGEVRHVVSTRLSLGKVRAEEDVLWSFAPHDVSMILGVYDREPKAVMATGHGWLQTGIADHASVHLRFADGCAASCHVSWAHPEKEQRLVVAGTSGMAVFDDRQPWGEKLMLYTDAFASGTPPVANKVGGDALSVEESEPLKAECAHFLARIADRERPRTDGHEGLRVLKVLAAATHSFETGAWVPLG